MVYPYREWKIYWYWWNQDSQQEKPLIHFFVSTLAARIFVTLILIVRSHEGILVFEQMIWLSSLFLRSVRKSRVNPKRSLMPSISSGRMKVTSRKLQQLQSPLQRRRSRLRKTQKTITGPVTIAGGSFVITPSIVTWNSAGRNPLAFHLLLWRMWSVRLNSLREQSIILRRQNWVSIVISLL